jgi:uncharacterized linocin/CFP29 family protein
LYQPPNIRSQAARSGVSVDVLGVNRDGAFVGQGGVAQRLLAANMDPMALRTNGTLRYDEWKLYDKVVVDVASTRLNVTQELLARGLSYPIPNALGVMQIQWETINDLEPASMTMSGLTEAPNDELNYALNFMPIPIIHKEFTLNLRQLTAARNHGNPLDTTQAELATRKVAQMIEQIIFTGATIASNSGNIYGLMTHPNRQTGSVSAPWATYNANLGVNVTSDIAAMQEQSVTQHMYGPYILFVPYSTYVAWGQDYKNFGSTTILQRVLEMPGIEAVIPTQMFTGNGGILVQTTSDVIQMVDGMQPTLVEWDTRGGFELNYRVMAIMLPRVSCDQYLQSGIVQYS